MPLLKQTTALTKISQLRKRLRVIQGGTSASKTFSILALLIHIAQSNDNLLISIVSESMPHIKKGAMRDFMAIMVGQQYFNPDSWNKSDSIYTFETGSQIEFFSADQPGKVRGPRRDILFLNECNNVSYEVYDQLSIRTRRLVLVDFNPVAEFWMHEKVMPFRDHDFLKLTYLDNEALSQQEIVEIESHKNNPNWWRVYGLGELGINEGQIFTNWTIIPTIPDGARLIRRGLDFGYTIDPTAVIDVYEYNGGYIFDEQIYQKGLSNAQIAQLVKGLPDNQVLIVADSAEPKSISEIHTYGVRITGSTKGPGSVNYGIQVIQDLTISVTQRSTNLIKEYRNYLWKVDRDGNAMNVPIDIWNHGMDALRYAMSDIKGKRKIRTFANKPEIFM